MCRATLYLWISIRSRRAQLPACVNIENMMLIVPLTKGPGHCRLRRSVPQHRDKGHASTITRTPLWSDSRAGRIPEDSQQWILPVSPARQEGAPGLALAGSSCVS